MLENYFNLCVQKCRGKQKLFRSASLFPLQADSARPFGDGVCSWVSVDHQSAESRPPQSQAGVSVNIFNNRCGHEHWPGGGSITGEVGRSLVLRQEPAREPLGGLTRLSFLWGPGPRSVLEKEVLCAKGESRHLSQTWQHGQGGIHWGSNQEKTTRPQRGTH